MTIPPIDTDPSHPEARTRRHRTWEYHNADTDRPMSAETLDALGERGWRLAGVVKYMALITYHFVRPARGAGP
jgi:hypothetical protein